MRFLSSVNVAAKFKDQREDLSFIHGTQDIRRPIITKTIQQSNVNGVTLVSLKSCFGLIESKQLTNLLFHSNPTATRALT